jgi:hypothetical protein
MDIPIKISRYHSAMDEGVEKTDESARNETSGISNVALDKALNGFIEQRNSLAHSLQADQKSIKDLAELQTINSNMELLATMVNLNSTIPHLPVKAVSDFVEQIDHIQDTLRSAYNPASVLAAANTIQQVLKSIRPQGMLAYGKPHETPEYYSRAMSSPATYFDPYASEITCVSDLHEAIDQLAKIGSGLSFVWRGQCDADWGLHSKLFRHLMRQNGVKSPSDHPKEKQAYPTETQMMRAEEVIIKQARDSWRLGAMPALEIFARIQHFGGPTRLLDATRNPYIAAWFAVQKGEDEKDGRLFALATAPAGDKLPKNLSVEVQKADPFWFQVSTIESRPLIKWGTGSRRIVWVPPVYESRIAAQDAVFILDGIPITTSRVLKYFGIPQSINGGKREYWKRPDILAAASIYVKMFHLDTRPRTNQLSLAPTYNFKIKADAKKPIRDYLTKILGYTSASIYPDVPGLAQFVDNLNYPSLKECENRQNEV